MSARRTVYLDHSASTPTDPQVVEAMLPYFTEVYGNPSSSHSFGRKAESAIETARETIAGILNCRPSEIVFTSGGSESDNLAVRGAAWYARTQGRDVCLITQPTEHSAIGRTVEQMETVMGFDVSYVAVDRFGGVSVDAFVAACRPEAVIASIMYANNEVGTLSPIRALADAAHERGILFHTDAVQAGGQMPLDVQALGVDMLSLSAHKFYGPKGVGLLYVRDGVKLISSQSGGSHEEGRRAGTHNTPYIIGMAKALELAYSDYDAHIAHYRSVRDRLIAGVLAMVNGAHLTGHPQDRLPSHASFIIDGVESNTLLVHLDMKGVAASSASACKTGNPEPSSVLMAMGYSPEESLTSLRLTVGRQTTTEDVDYAVNVLSEAVEKIQRIQV